MSYKSKKFGDMEYFGGAYGPPKLVKEAKSLSKDHNYRMSRVIAAAMRKFMNLSDEEKAAWYEIAYDLDPDAVPNVPLPDGAQAMTPEQLHDIQMKLGMNAARFADALGIPKPTLRVWKHRESKPIPPDVARRALELLESEPKLEKVWTGKDVTELRTKLDITQRDLARKLDAAVETVNRWEAKPEKELRWEWHRKLSELELGDDEALNVDEEYIIGAYRKLPISKQDEFVLFLRRLGRSVGNLLEGEADESQPTPEQLAVAEKHRAKLRERRGKKSG